MHVQTYSKEDGLGAVYAFHLEFAQTVVWEEGVNELGINFRRLALVPEKVVSKMKMQLRVSSSHGCHWKG